MAKVSIPPALRKLAQGEREIDIDGGTLGEAIEKMDARYRGLRDKLINASGQVPRYISMFVDDEDIRYLKGLETPLRKNTQVSVLVAVAGG